jgi:ABC-2 type transport system ATP-binding protein
VLAEIAQTVDQVVIIDRGRLVAVLPLDELGVSSESLEARYLELTAGGVR